MWAKCPSELSGGQVAWGPNVRGQTIRGQTIRIPTEADANIF